MLLFCFIGMTFVASATSTYNLCLFTLFLPVASFFLKCNFKEEKAIIIINGKPVSLAIKKDSKHKIIIIKIACKLPNIISLPRLWGPLGSIKLPPQCWKCPQPHPHGDNAIPHARDAVFTVHR